jgi:lysophospholipase L1-like esterase
MKPYYSFSILFATLVLPFAVIAAPAAPLPPIRVILVGDSTMASRSGYGDALCASFTPEVTCINQASAGRSSGSFRSEGRWGKVQQMLRDNGQFSASYVLVQFGHNDQPGKPGHSTDLVTQFPVNMARYVTEAKALGALPVLVTPLTRRTFQGAYLHDDLGPWAEATRQVAIGAGAPLLDLNADSAAAVQQMGQDEADTLSPPPRSGTVPAAANDTPKEGAASVSRGRFDRTHLGSKGATYFAGMVGRELAQSVPALVPYLRKR